MYGAPAENCSGPENRDASILVGKHRANRKEFFTLNESRDRSVELLATAGWQPLAGWLGRAGLVKLIVILFLVEEMTVPGL